MVNLVRDLMHPGVITCRPDATIGQVAVMLFQHQVHSLIVTDRDDRPLGIITDFDLLAGEWLSADPDSLEVMRSITAGDLMTSPIDTIEGDSSASQAAQRMREQVIRRLIVTEKGRPIGVISVSDFVAQVAKKVPLKREIVSDVMSDAILVCRDKTPVSAAARAMTLTGWRSVLVVNAAGKTLGVVSGLDILAHCEVDGPENKTVSEVMHPVITVSMSTSLRQAADLMIENHHHRLIVVDLDQPDSMPLGVISSFDIVEEMARPGSVWQS
jgi:CBS domain-containing protein